MEKFEIANREIVLPTEWKELSDMQVLKLVHAKSMVEGNKPYDMLAQWLYSISGIIPMQKDYVVAKDLTVSYWYKIGKEEVLIHEALIAQMTRALEWVFEIDEEEIGDDLEPTLIFKLVPKIWANPLPFFKGLYGPADGITNCTYNEYADAEVEFFKYAHSRDKKHLDRLIATLWRPKKQGLTTASKKYQGDLRLPYNVYYTDQLAKKVAKWPELHKQAILLFYLSMRWYLAQNFDLVFTVDDNAKQGPVPQPDIFQFHLDITHYLSKQDVTERNNVRNQLLYDVMDTLQSMRKEAIAMQERLESTKTDG